MASIFKRGRDKARKLAPYTIAYTDHNGKRRMTKGFTDKSLSEQLAAKIENEVLLRKRGMIDPEVERRSVIRNRPIKEHLESFEKTLVDTAPKYKKNTMYRIRRIVEGCGFKSVDAIDAEQVQAFLQKIREEESLSPRTFNHYLQAMNHLCNWLVGTKRLLSNPLVGLEPLNTEVDIRRPRRALTPDEMACLLKAAEVSMKSIDCYDGPARARVYLFSFLTGLRRRELAGLTPGSFDLTSSHPTLTVDAACSKHRRKDTLPLHPDLVERLKEWLPKLRPDEPLFPKLDQRRTWVMVKHDLKLAEIPYKTKDGYADFHASGRHSHITGLLRNGASLVEAKELARHCDVRMTMKYTHIGLDDQAKALASLPFPTSGNRQRIGSDSVCVSGHEGATSGTDNTGDGQETSAASSDGNGAWGKESPLPSHPGRTSAKWPEQVRILPGALKKTLRIPRTVGFSAFCIS